MIEGYIPTPAIEWIPKHAEPRIVYTNAKEKGFRLGRFHMMSMKRQVAWYCSHCNIILIDCNAE